MSAACDPEFCRWGEGDRPDCPNGCERPAAWSDVPSNTASANVDYKAAWEAAAKVVVAAGRFVEAEREGNAALIEDAHFGLLAALADYRADRKSE